jgi:hypothetical protein
MPVIIAPVVVKFAMPGMSLWMVLSLMIVAAFAALTQALAAMTAVLIRNIFLISVTCALPC